MNKQNIFSRIRRYFNPTFEEWLEDFSRDFHKQLQNPKVVSLITKIRQR